MATASGQTQALNPPPRPPAAQMGRLPEIQDEALAPFSRGFAGGFDPDTISQTAQLADRSIFVTARGTFKVERIGENPTYPQQQQRQQQPYTQHAGPQFPSQGQVPMGYPQVPVQGGGYQQMSNVNGFYGNEYGGQYAPYQNPNPNATRMGHPGQTGQSLAQSQNMQYPPGMAPQPLHLGRGQQQKQASYQPSIKRRPVSTPSPAPSSTSSGSHQPGQYQGGLRTEVEPTPVSPIGSVNDLAGQMGSMSIQNEYAHSPTNYAPVPTTLPVDGMAGPKGQHLQGLPVVQETGDGDQGRYAAYRPPPTASSSRYVQQQQPQQPMQQQPMYGQYQQGPYPPQQLPPSQFQQGPYPPQQPSPYSRQAQSQYPPEVYPQPQNQYPNQGYQYRQQAGMSTVSSLPSLSDGPSTRSNSVAYSSSDGRIPIINDTHERPLMAVPADPHFDTQTPVLVVPNEHKQQPAHTKSQSDTTSQRDNVRPGEELAFESEPGFVKTAPLLSGPFMDATLKVFRNTLSNELRFYVKVGLNSETYWMKGTNAQLVPLYAFDHRARNIIYVRDKTSLPPSANEPNAPPQTSSGGGPQRPTGNFQFTRVPDLFRFQARLTGEDVVLDISTVAWAKLQKTNSRSTDTYTSVRVQLWHEPRSRRTMGSDTASFVTAGTALSGPVRERVVANSSRLIVFLGRMESFITVFVTDDIEIDRKKTTTVKLKPRKYGGLSRTKTRSGVLGRMDTKRGSEPAGLDINGQAFDPDMEYTFDVYKTFEIEFENEQSQIEFCQAWEEVMVARRRQRVKLKQIQEDMKEETYTGKEARKILL